ncbi:GNAT superfamily N-acetyltransferase [Streptacidiphilus sp. BW17]|uniref:GNAT family N-acetyltransferase n=1 Tax=Streptacidiphilus sp. BW17 TaxID=3156274 RepID=UPI00351899D2
MGDFRVRAAGPDDRERISELLGMSWGGAAVVAHGTVYDALHLPALLAERDGRVVGLLTYTLSPGGLEVVTLDAVPPRGGVGSALLDAGVVVARRAGAARLWLVTTNDNLDALRFYQRRGLRIVSVAPGAVDAARLVKPSIPETGEYGIPLHDELTLELRW